MIIQLNVVRTQFRNNNSSTRFDSNLRLVVGIVSSLAFLVQLTKYSFMIKILFHVSLNICILVNHVSEPDLLVLYFLRNEGDQITLP